MKKLLNFTFIFLFSAALLAQNTPPLVPTSRPIPSGPEVLGIFAGRCPCQELATLLKVTVSSECFKSKWEITLFHDPKTHQPTTFQLIGTAFRKNDQNGSWKISKGIKNDPEATVYELQMENATLKLLKADDNLLFMLDHDRNLLVGNELFSYTLNRIEKKPMSASK
ncbi:hypothetical protein [Runella sp. SP2]|uniref:hypothetical protein n=1 Tax=Runella sp. SP2 TaxID=2268026 RepID=UPI000F07E3B5|nr:hypothetical protein [Runella sp. SP2]AYQ33119.1 hypothetical protein DTQ70_13560 [Runella sp. SP2]